jgi:asparagine synthase (glutamine-hydrolysing)
MTNVMSHRGPDDEGLYIDGNLGLGHRRLSIIDLSSLGHQPMANEDKTVWVIFNGEIYNYKQLRSELLSQGHAFVSQSDTEVIVHAYEEYGDDCFKKLSGMFSIGIWDVKRRKVVLARDRVGVKPLYYYDNGNIFLWASEIKAILEDPCVKREVDMESLGQFLTFHYVPAPRTMFRGICKLLPGHILSCDGNGMKIQKFWDLPVYEKKLDDYNYLKEKVYEDLRESVKNRLQSDVPLGVLLSGGLDSSAILGLMTELQGKPVKSFTVGYSNHRNDRFSEFPSARAAAKYFNSDHHEVIVDSKKFIEYLPKASWHEDEPVGEDSAVPLHFVSKLAKSNGVTVLLTGEGSDELFAGYNRHWGEIIAGCYQVVPESLRNSILNTLIKAVPGVPLLKKGHRSMTIQDFPGRYMSWHTVVENELKKELLLTAEGACVTYHDVFRKFEKHIEKLDPLDKILYLDFHVWLPDDLLMKKDKMGMSVSIEARVPFLDYKFVEFAFNISNKMKVKNLTTKYILKKSMERVLPKNIIYQKKQGFPTPISGWLRHDLREFAHDLLLSPDSNIRLFFNQGVIRTLLEEHVSGREDHWKILFSLINFELWYRAFFKSS